MPSRAWSRTTSAPCPWSTARARSWASSANATSSAASTSARRRPSASVPWCCADVMTREPESCDLDNDVEEVMGKMSTYRIAKVPVLCDSKLCSIVSVGDVVIRVLYDKGLLRESSPDDVHPRELLRSRCDRALVGVGGDAAGQLASPPGFGPAAARWVAPPVGGIHPPYEDATAGNDDHSSRGLVPVDRQERFQGRWRDRSRHESDHARARRHRRPSRMWAGDPLAFSGR